MDRDWPPLSQAAHADAPPGASACGAGAPVGLCHLYFGQHRQSQGTLVQHNHVVRLFPATDRYFHFSATDAWTLFHSLSFDFSVGRSGARSLRWPAGHRPLCRPPLAEGIIRNREARTGHRAQPDSVGVHAVDEGMSGYSDRRASPCDTSFSWGALSISRLKPWFAGFGETSPQLVNMYGITETTVHVTYYAVRQADTGAGIGPDRPPATGPESRRSRPNGQLCPMGVVGEIYVGGRG